MVVKVTKYQREKARTKRPLGSRGMSNLRCSASRIYKLKKCLLHDIIYSCLYYDSRNGGCASKPCNLYQDYVSGLLSIAQLSSLWYFSFSSLPYRLVCINKKTIVQYLNCVWQYCPLAVKNFLAQAYSSRAFELVWFVALSFKTILVTIYLNDYFGLE